jgi:hypothetical protein
MKKRFGAIRLKKTAKFQRRPSLTPIKKITGAVSGKYELAHMAHFSQKLAQ